MASLRDQAAESDELLTSPAVVHVTIAGNQDGPVRIVDLATDLIRLSSLEVEKDVQIKFTGMRPGEKLYEEMFFRAEYVVPTQHAEVLRARDHSVPVDSAKRIDRLIAMAAEESSDDELRRMIKSLVPDFHLHGWSSHQTEVPIVRETLRFSAIA